jgi:hypothetical protein
MSSSLIKQALKITNQYLKPAFRPVYKQAMKFTSNQPIHQKRFNDESFYTGGVFGRGEAITRGSGESLYTTLRNYIDPTRIRNNEAFRDLGISTPTLDSIKTGWKAQDDILMDPRSWRRNWVGGKTGGKNPQLKPENEWSFDEAFMRQIKSGKKAGEWKKEFLTDEAKNLMRYHDKNIWGELYKDRAYISKSGIIPKNNKFMQFFDEEMGQVYDLKEFTASQMDQLGYTDDILANVLKTWKLNNAKNPVNILKMHNKKLNSLSRDVQFDMNYRDLVKMINEDPLFSTGQVGPGLKMAQLRMKRLVKKDLSSQNDPLDTFWQKFKYKWQRLRGTDKRRKGFTPEIIDDSLVISFGPSMKSNFYTGGINGKVFWSPKDPDYFRIVPSDAFDLFGKNTEWMAKKVFGLQNNVLNVMGIKKVKIPDHTKWGKGYWKNQIKLNDKIMSGKSDLGSYKRPTKPFTGGTFKAPEPLNQVVPPRNKYSAITKSASTKIDDLITEVDTKKLPTKRYLKQSTTTGLFAAGTLTLGATGVKAMSSSNNNRRVNDDDEEYNSYHAQANTKEHRFKE